MSSPSSPRAGLVSGRAACASAVLSATASGFGGTHSARGCGQVYGWRGDVRFRALWIVGAPLSRSVSGARPCSRDKVAMIEPWCISSWMTVPASV